MLLELYVYTNSLGPTSHLNCANARSVAWILNMPKIVFNNEIGWTRHKTLTLFISCYRSQFFRIVGDLPFLQKASFRAEVVTPKMRLKREIIFSFEGMIVSFGGAATLFLGISLWQLSKSLLFIINKILGVFK